MPGYVPYDVSDQHTRGFYVCQVLSRSKGRYFFENSAKIVAVGITDHVGDLRYVVIAMLQIILCQLDAVLVYEFRYGKSRFLFEFTGKGGRV